MTRGQIKNRIIAGIMAFLMVCLFLVPADKANAKDSFVSQYIQYVYNQQNGLGSSEINCLYQSASGYIWVGTDGGLYRSKGSEFTSIKLWDTDRADVYSINCISQGADGRMWIGTDNYGLFTIKNGEIYHFQNEYYNGIKSINQVCEAADGTIYVATAQGLYCVARNEEGEEYLEKYIDESVARVNIKSIVAFNDNIWAISGSNTIYVLGRDSLAGTINTTDITGDELNAIDVIEDKVYIGTTGRDILCFSSAASYKVLTAGIDGVNTTMADSRGVVWCCGDNGIGYFNSNNEFVKLEGCEIDSYITDAICDYEGNYWFASNRMGVLYLSRSKFQDFNMLTGMGETMVNTVFTRNGMKYIGTEDGLVIYDRDNSRVTNELTDMLNGVRIRHIMCDSKGTMWISTYRRYGVVRVGTDNEVSFISKSGGLPSIISNCTLELSGDRIAVGTEDGLAILKENGELIKSYTSENGLVYSNITCLYQQEDGCILAGTDDGGIYVINPETDEINRFDTTDGLSSDNITVITGGNEGVWIGTDNGVSFYNESFRTISNIEYTNSIYDIIIYDDNVYIVGSMGLLVTTESELIGSQGISGRYFDANDGLTKTLNAISKSTIDNRGILYLCCNTGICTIDTKNMPYNDIPPKIKVTSIDVDGKTYEFDGLGGSLNISSRASKVTIDFAVFSYSNRSNIQVEYYLKGFDEEPIVISGNEPMRAVYTNLEGQEYEFVINAYNGDGVKCMEEVSFTIEKNKSFFENRWARVLIIAIVTVFVMVAIYFGIRIAKILKTKNSAIEKLSKEHEKAMKSSSAKNDYLANMSNEIKTPINAIVARADELIKITPDDDERKKIIQNIYETGNDIIAKVDDIILLAKIEAGKMSVANQTYSVPDLIYEVSEEAVSKIGDRSIKFFVEMGDDTQENLIGDVDKLRDILSRLIDNSIKYTKEGSITISVDCFSYSNRNHHDMVNVLFTVSDTGIGIPDTKLENIFEVSNIADNVKGSHSGIGVGLAISKGYANLLNAELEAESIYGAGSTFSLSLNQKIAGTSSGGNMISKIEGTVSKEDAEKLWLPDVSVLLIDDDEVSREVAAKTLEKFEMKVDMASSGISAIDMALNNSYDVIFMDLNMPVMNGIEAMKEIRELEGDDYAYLSIIAMDTDAIEENRDRLLSEGFTDSLLKPLDIRRVAAILKDCLPQDKIKEKTNDLKIYIGNSRYSDGLSKLSEVLDIEAALKKIGGSIDVFNKLLTIFYNQNASAGEELYEKQGKDARGFKTKIHSIKTNSLNIGATALAQEATRMEAAINIGNREYVKENLEKLNDYLIEVLLVIEDYQEFMESVAGMTDEEYNQKIQEQHAENESDSTDEAADLTEATGNREKSDTESDTVAERIDILRLENIKYTALDGEFDAVSEELAILDEKEYAGEDKEFMEVLKQAVEAKDVAKIDELVSTYLSLKM